MKVLITGISGFSGSFLAERLLEQGQLVCGLSKSPTDIENVVDILGRMEVQAADIRDAAKVGNVVAEIQPDIIYHLAAEASTHRSLQNPVDTVATNVMGTLHLLEAARRLKKAPRVLLVTSAEIYGTVQPEETPVIETSPLRPLHPYAFSKVAVHYLAFQYYETYQLQVIEARAFNHIGPRQTLDFVVPDFAYQLAEIKVGSRKNKISVGDLSAERDFCDVRDVVRAYQLIAEQGKPGEVYHVCSGSAHSIQEILDILLSFCDVEVEVVVDKEKIRPVKMPLIVGSLEKIRKELGWQPGIPLRESLLSAFEFWLEKAKTRKADKTTA